MSEQSHEFSAKSVEAAIEEGLRQLGVGRDRVDIEVLHEGSRGLLGIGSTNARVRITLRAAAPAARNVPAATPPPRRPRPPIVLPPTPVMEAIGASESRGLPIGDSEIGGPQVDNGDEDEDESIDLSTGIDGEEAGGEEEPAYDDLDADRDAVVALASEMLLEMVSLMGLDAQVEGSQRQEEDEDEAAIYLNLIGDDLGDLIGRHGETLSSMQYLVRLMVNQKLHRWTNIVVDVDGYKDRRAEKLAQMALRMADQVVETGKSVALEPMPANERRLIHIALRNHPQVHTESVGEDTRRKIQILLK